MFSAVASALALLGSLFLQQRQSPWSPAAFVPTTPINEALLLRSAPFAEAHSAFVAQLAAMPANVSVEEFMTLFVSQAMPFYHLPSVGYALIDGNVTRTAAFTNDGGGAAMSSGNASSLLFRIASITKSVTATGIMMLLQDKLIGSLDDDINRYLDADLQYTAPLNGTAITLRHLLVHRAGFEEQTIAQIVDDEAQLLPLRAYLARIRPPQHFPAGAVPAYSNFGFSLLGRIIERVTNGTYEQFVRERIFAPLGMSMSVISPRDPLHTQGEYWDRQAPQVAPNPTDIKSDVGTANLGPYVFQYVPAGQVMMTPDDMARYARFHLSGGQTSDGKQLLDAALVAEMHGSGAMPLGAGFGFIKVQVGGNTTVFLHDGDMPTMSSRMIIIPSQQRAIFVSFGKGTVPLREKLTADFGKQFAAEPFGGLAPSNAALPADEAPVQGTFAGTRTMFTGCLSFVARVTNTQLEAYASADGKRVSFGAPYDNANVRYVRAEPGVYVQTINTLSVDVPDYLAFPYLFSKTVGSQAEYVVLLDPLAGFYNTDGASSPLGQLAGVLLILTLAVLVFFCLCCSCCYHQFVKKNTRDSMERSYTLKDAFARRPARGGDESLALTATPKGTANATKPSPWRTERMQHDVAVYCYTPFVLALLVIMLAVYSQTIQELGSGFPSVGAFVFFPFAFMVSTVIGVTCAAATLIRCHWWLDRRILFAVLHVSLFAFAVVWGTIGGGFHFDCYAN
jgi:CubicO group peptidase (beta-lactamase class C family)